MKCYINEVIVLAVAVIVFGQFGFGWDKVMVIVKVTVKHVKW